MKFTAYQIAQLVGGQVEGNPEATVSSFGKIEEATANQLAFLANPKYEDYLYTTAAQVVIVNDKLELKQPVSASLIRVPDAYSAFATLLDKYQHLKTQQLSGIESPVYRHPTAVVGDNVYLGAFCYLGENVVLADNVKVFPNVVLGANVKVGQNTIIHAGVKIYHDCVVGENVIIHAGAVIGSDGFGFAPQGDGSRRKVPQIGNVVIEDNVEIGANTTIDRATIGSTIIRSGVKLDNLLQIAHNVEVGSNTVIAALVGVSGSTKIGKNVMIGGQAGIVGHITIADGTKINGKSGVSKSILEPNRSLSGTPAQDFTAAMREQALTRNLPEMERRLKEMEKIVQELLAARQEVNEEDF